ncbi:T9SS type A sorting domain-containing protein [candidate division WOR-3 bacterium]|nr:T9SS type A sorting domain-containing protein [candidate division WOR-3 bacterium]
MIVNVLLLIFPVVYIAQTENWVYKYDGPDHLYDIAYSVAYGNDGNIYAAGISQTGYGHDTVLVVVSLSPAGDTNWIYRFQGIDNSVGRAITYGNDNNIYAAGNSYVETWDTDFLVISLTPMGDTNWVYSYEGLADNRDEALSIAYGSDSNIYITGYCCDNYNDYRDIIVISLSPAGDTNWIYRYDRPANSWDMAYSIIYGIDGNIYAAGHSNGVGTFLDATIISLSPAGNTNWIYRYDGSIHDDDVVYSITQDSVGNLYAAGYSRTGAVSYDFIVISMTIDGDTNWIYRYDESIYSFNEGLAVTYGNDGNIYAAGYTTIPNSSGIKFTVISFTTGGDTNWLYQHDAAGDTTGKAYALTYGLDGNIYASGYLLPYVGGRRFAVISLSPAGNVNWVYTHEESSVAWNEAFSVVYGNDGNIYAAGRTLADPNNYYDLTVVSINPETGIKEEKLGYFSHSSEYIPSVFSGPLVLPEDKNCKVFDITGREVDTDKLSPGIYFIEIDGKMTQKVIKIR